MSRTSLIALLSATIFASAASADVIIKIKETDDPQSKKPTVNTGAWVFSPEHLSMRWDDADATHGGVVFDAGKDVLYVIDDMKKSYKQIDKAFVDQIAGQMNTVRAQIAQLPPEQRAKAEEMMKKYEGGSATTKAEYRKTAETKVINGATCTKYDRYAGEELESHLWVAPYSALKLTPGDGVVFQKMGEFTDRLTGALGGIGKHDSIPMHELNGVPLLTQEIEHGKVTRETTVESVTHEAAPPGVYSVPAGYKLEALEK